jgi:hypothetical protein
MRIQISLSAFPYDVDHMNGAVRKKTEEIYTEYAPWKKHADAVNTKFHDDNAEIISTSRQEFYEVDGFVFALWNSQKRIGTVNNQGKRLERR